jgi:hypothetical protein
VRWPDRAWIGLAMIVMSLGVLAFGYNGRDRVYRDNLRDCQQRHISLYTSGQAYAASARSNWIVAHDPALSSVTRAARLDESRAQRAARDRNRTRLRQSCASQFRTPSFFDFG